MPVPEDIREQALNCVDQNCNELIAFASRLISIPSPNPPGAESAIARVVEDHLRELGFADVRIVGPRPERANLICRVSSGRPGHTLILNGHLDTKPPGSLEAWNSDPFRGEIRDGKLYGLGAADMKGPDGSLVYGLLAAVQSGKEHLFGELLLILSVDEEGPAMDGARYLVQEIGTRADSVLIAEPSGITKSWEMIPVISRGLSCVRFTVKGTQMHSSISDQLPVVNANLEASRLLLYLKEHLRLEYKPTPLCPRGPTINLGATMKGGQAYAMVAGEAEFTADIRTLPGMSREHVARDIDRTVEAFRQEYPQARVDWQFFPGKLGWTQPTAIAPDLLLVRALQGAAETVLGTVPPLGCFPGGTDAIWWHGAAGIPTIPGFGPGLLSNCHKPNEYVATEELIQAAKIYALTILNYLCEGQD